MGDFTVLIIGWLLCGFLAAVVAARRNASATGFLLGLLFGPLGILVAFAIDGRTRCANCRQRLEPGAAICPHCQTEVHHEETMSFVCPKCRNGIVASSDNQSDVMACPICRELIPVPARIQDALRRATPASNPRLRACPDCGAAVSRRASACPKCGCPAT